MVLRDWEGGEVERGVGNETERRRCRSESEGGELKKTLSGWPQKKFKMVLRG